VGTLGDLTCFSFYATKNVTTAEGGMIVAADEEIAARIRVRALHGLSADAWKRYSDEGFQHYQVVCPGYKYNMTDLQAALGLHQLARVEENLVRREAIWDRYMEALAGLPLELPAPPAEGTRHARHLFTVMVTDDSPLDRDRLQAELHRLNIGTGVHYVAVHLHQYYRETFSWDPGDYPESTGISRRTLSLPLSPGMTDEDVEDVIRTLKHLLA
jgi:dTDP-4-amino-4,6-dideoxygalactose transaminase